MDTGLFHLLNSVAGQSAFVDHVIVFCGSYLAYVLAGALAIAALWPIVRIRMAIAAVISAGVARGIVKTIIVLFVHRARPFVVVSGAHQLISTTGEEYQSFPSGHAIFFFALAMALARYDRRLGWWFFAGATLMGIGRVAAGIHWPSDILAGAILGILTAELVTRLIPALRPQPLEKAS